MNPGTWNPRSYCRYGPSALGSFVRLSFLTPFVTHPGRFTRSPPSPPSHALRLSPLEAEPGVLRSFQSYRPPFTTLTSASTPFSRCAARMVRRDVRRMEGWSTAKGTTNIRNLDENSIRNPIQLEIDDMVPASCLNFRSHLSGLGSLRSPRHLVTRTRRHEWNE